jgi:hypothetical protein
MRTLLIVMAAVWLLSVAAVAAMIVTAPLDTDIWEDGEPR